MSMPFPIASDEDFKRLVENPLFHQLLDALSIGVSLTGPYGDGQVFFAVWLPHPMGLIRPRAS